MNLKTEEFLKVSRFYVFFADGSWRTCTNDQWKEEQLWKLKPEYTCWVGGEAEVRVIKALEERFNSE